MTSCLLLAGCKSVAPDLDASPSGIPETPASPPPPPSIDPVVLHNLLDAADIAIEEGRLTFPKEDSALSIYHQILTIEPGQADATRGLERLVELYIELTMTSLRRGLIASARSMLARARLIDPEHPSIEPTEAQIRLIGIAERKNLKLSQTDLHKRPPQLSENLAVIARVPAGRSCLYNISAKNDAQGRWIYQQLAESKADGRIRAQINIRLPAEVERLCFPL